MADKFDNFVDGGYGLKPQAADPSNPKNGDKFESDGTSRAAGFWEYQNGWRQIGAGNTDLSIYKQFDAEDGDTTSFTNISISATSPLAGDNSYTVDSYTASFPSITMQDRHADKLHGMECHYKMTSGTAKLVIKDNAANVLVEQEISSTSTEKASLQYYVNSSVTSVQLSIESVSSPVGLKMDDLIFTDSPFVSVDLHTISSLQAAGNAGEVISSGVTDIPFIEIADSNGAWDGDTYTVQDNDSVIEMSWSCLFTTTSSRVFRLFKNGSSYNYVGNVHSLDYHSSSYVSAKGEFAKGDTLNIRLSGTGTLSNDSEFHWLNIVEKANSEHLVFSQSGTENVFSARIANNGTASITSESFPFIQTVNRSAVGVVDITLKSGFFTVIPASSATTDADFNVGINQGTLSLTNITVKTEIMDGTNTDSDFTLTVQRQGSDYKNPNAYAVVPTSLIAFIKDVKSSATAGGTFTSGAWQTRDLNDLSGDSFVSLSANQFTLPAGKYHIIATAPAIQVDQHKVKLRNITDSTDDIIGSTRYSPSPGTALGSQESELMGLIEISSSKTYELQHYAITTQATFGFGSAAGIAGIDEIYSQISITRLK